MVNRYSNFAWLLLHRLHLDRPPNWRAEENVLNGDIGPYLGRNSAGGFLCGRAPHDASIRLD